MAAIGSIRKRSGLLITMIGVALVLFLLGDFFTGGANMFTQQEVNIGNIGGKDIDQREYEIRVQEEIEKQFQGEGANERAKAQVRERVWLRMINEIIVEKEFDKLGIGVSPEELLDQVQNTQPGTILYQYFTDPNTGQIIEQFRDPMTGGINSVKVFETIQNLINSENVADWLPIEAAIKSDVANRKYTTLVSKGLYTPMEEARAIHSEKNTAYAFSYVLQEFSSIPDDEIEITEADYTAYYNEHKDEALFQNEEESRDLLYVEFPLAASKEDIEDITKELTSLIPEFTTDTNDTSFVLDNGESDLEELIKYYSKKELPISIQDTVTKSEIGTVFGPYQNGPKMFISKLSKIKQSPDSVQASHILIKVEDGDTAKLAAARAKLDSLKSLSNIKRDFADIASSISEDLGSAEKGGELDWFKKGMMVPPFEKASFDGAVGDLPIVETQFGVHLIYITDQTEYKNRYLLSSVDLLIEPSDMTSDAVYKEASTFSVTNGTLTKFESAEGRPVMPIDGLRASEKFVGQIGPDSKDILIWAYSDDVEVGTVSTPFEYEDKIVVVALKKIRPEGTASLEASKIFIKPEVIKEKKSEQFIAKYGSYSNLEEAGQNAGKDVQRVASVRFDDNNISGGIGRDFMLLGALGSLESGEVSKPVVGNRGVYVLRMDGVNAEADETKLAETQTISTNAYSSRADRKAIEAVKEAVGVEDNRNKFY